MSIRRSPPQSVWLGSRVGRSSFSPFAARTQQYVKEQLGTADDKVCLPPRRQKLMWIMSPQLNHGIQTELPPDYIELEKRVDALKQVHQKLLQVTYYTLSRSASELPTLPTDYREARNTPTKPTTTPQHPRVLQRPGPYYQ